MYYKIGTIELDSATHSVLRDGKTVNLTPLEFALLEYLMQHADTLCTRDDILDHVWGERFRYDTGTIDVHLNALRRKLGCTRNKPIETIRGTGFIMHTEKAHRPYSLIIQPFISEWLARHADTLRRKGLTPRIQLDPFVSELTMSPDDLCTLLDGILAALLPSAKPGTIRISSHLSMTHFSLVVDINGTSNELRIPIYRDF